MSTADTPPPPYVAVIFSAQRTDRDEGEYVAAADAMERLASRQPGYLGVESARRADGFGITVSYWATEEHARAWKAVAEHLDAQRAGIERWYRHYVVRVAVVERSYTSAHRAAASRGRRLLHVALPDDWSVAQREGVLRVSTRGRTLDDEGFVHCSYPDQVVGVLTRYYGDLDEVVLLELDPLLLGAEVIDEPPAPHAAELFPHVYGPIPAAAVRRSWRWQRDERPWSQQPLPGLLRD